MVSATVDRSCSVLDTGIDWLTCTGLSKKSSMVLASRALQIISAERRAGNDMVPWGMAGFNGYKVGQIQSGENGDKFLVRLSGGLASREWKWFAERADSVSRIDLQATVFSEEDTRLRMQRHIRQAKRFKRKNPHSGEVTIYDRVDKPKTIYLNQRVSDRFMRCYDKENESGSEFFRGCLRYEVEFKNDLAGVIASSALNSECLDSFILREVSRNFAVRGWPSINGPVESRPIGLSRGRSDNERRLDWLQTMVRPSVQMLCSNGYSKEVLSALGLEQLLGNASRFLDQTENLRKKRG